MKRLWIVAVIVALAFALTACGGGDGGDEEEAKSDYPVQTVSTENWDMSLTNHEISDSDTEEGKKVITFYFTFENTSDRELIYGDTVNAHFTQADANLWIYDSKEPKDPIAAGESKDVEIAFTLNDEETPVDISIGGYTSSVAREDITVDIK